MNTLDNEKYNSLIKELAYYAEGTPDNVYLHGRIDALLGYDPLNMGVITMYDMDTEELKEAYMMGYRDQEAE